MVHVFSQVRQRQKVVTVMTFANVSIALPLQYGHAVGRVAGGLTPVCMTYVASSRNRASVRFCTDF
jgi:hypothetical protein